jgi:hypothetical protein
MWRGHRLLLRLVERESSGLREGWMEANQNLWRRVRWEEESGGAQLGR